MTQARACPEEDIPASLRRRDLRALKRAVAESGPGIPGVWERLSPLEKAAVFHLMEPEAALEFYDSLPARERYFLLCAWERGCLSPLLEGLPASARALFPRRSARAYERMLRRCEAAFRETAPSRAEPRA